MIVATKNGRFALLVLTTTSVLLPMAPRLSAQYAAFTSCGQQIGKETIKPTGAEKNGKAVNPNDKDPILRLETGGHVGRIRTLLYTYEKRFANTTAHLLSVGNDKTVRFWKRAEKPGPQSSSKLLSDPPIRFNSHSGVEGEIWSASFDPTHQLLAFGQRAKDGDTPANIIITDASCSKKPVSLNDCHGFVHSVQFSPDGNLLAACDLHNVYLYSKTDNGWRRIKSVKYQIPFALAFSPDGKLLAVGTANDNISFIATGDPKVKAPGSLRLTSVKQNGDITTNGDITAISWSSKGLAAGDTKGNFGIWSSVTSQKSLEVLAKKNSLAVLSMAFDSTGSILAIGLNGEANAATGQPARTLLYSLDNKQLKSYPAQAPVTALCFVPYKPILTIGEDTGRIETIEIKAGGVPGENLKEFSGIGSPVFELQWIGDTGLTWKTGAGQRLNFDLAKMNASDDIQKSGTPSLRFEPQPDGSLTFHEGDATLKIDPIGKADTDILGKPQNGIPLTMGIYNRDRRLAFVAEGQETRTIIEYEMSDPKNPVILRKLTHTTGEVLSMAESPDGRYLAVGTSDQLIHIFDISHDSRPKQNSNNFELQSPLLSLFASEKDWIIWNPTTGVYASSDFGDDILCFQFNGPEGYATTNACSCCQKLYQSTSLLQEIFKSSSLDIIRDRVRQPLQQYIKQIPTINRVRIAGAIQNEDGVWETTDPFATIEIDATNPDPEQKLTTKATNTQGRNTGGRSIIPDPLHPQTNTPNEVGNRVDIYGGSINSIRVVATNGSGSSEPIIIKVRNRNGKDTKGLLHVLAIGASKYANISSLTYPSRDATEIAACFKNRWAGLYTGIDTIVLTDDSQTLPTAENIRVALKTLQSGEKSPTGEWIHPPVGPNDTVVFFVSGHGGALNPTDPTDKSCYFYASNYSPKDPANTAVNWVDITTYLSNAGALRTYLFVDHCFAAGGLTNQDARQTTSKNLADKNFIVFVSSGATEQSWEDARWKHGAFTYVLLEALQGHGLAGGQSDENGFITVAGVRSALLRDVPLMVQTIKGERQKPEVWANERKSANGFSDSSYLQYPIINPDSLNKP